MKHSAASNSLEVETRHLLRHLDSPKTLRRNALVSHIFEQQPDDAALAAIRALVRRALDTMVDQSSGSKRQRATRLREIITRYDLNGESSYGVAHDLGLSLRHFYRERRAACFEMGALLRRLLPGEGRSSHVIASAYEVTEAAAHGMVLAGAPVQGLAQFLCLASTASEPLHRISALCDAAMIMIELYDPSAAQRVLAEAERLLSERRGFSAASESEARSLIDFARALTMWDNERGGSAPDLARHTMRRAHRYVNELSATGLRLHAGERIRYATRALFNGDMPEATRLLHESEPFIDLLEQRVPFLHIDYANVRCSIALETPGPWEDAAQLASTAYDESRRQGYLVGAASSARSLGNIMGHRGDVRAAELAAATVEFARNNNSPRLLAYARIGAAEIYNLIELHARALQEAQNAAETLQTEPRRLRQAQLAQAHALLGLGRVLDAENQARAALLTASDDRDYVAQGIALRILAETAATSGSGKIARSRIDEALAALERGGRQRAMLEATRAASKIAKLTR